MFVCVSRPLALSLSLSHSPFPRINVPTLCFCTGKRAGLGSRAKQTVVPSTPIVWRVQLVFVSQSDTPECGTDADHGLHRSKQISGLREAFTTIDGDGDGFISRQDIKTMLLNLGQNGDDAIVDKYMKSALKEGGSGSERINFTQFLTMFGEHLSEVS